LLSSPRAVKAAHEFAHVSSSPASAALSALCLVARLHHIAAEPGQLAHQLGWPPSHVPGTADLLLAARHLGLKARLSRSNADRLPLAALPALALLKGGGLVMLAQCDGQRVLYMDPAAATPGEPARPTIAPLAEFAALWSGELILVTSRASLAGTLTRFDFSWFIPSLVRYRRLLGEVLVVSLFLQLFALVSPLFFQVVMDKVLVHRTTTTLDVLVIGLLVIVVFESVLTTLRTYVFSHTTSRIDVELGARLIRHLLNLPLEYFQARRVGDSVARVRELENIRSFLTGSSLTLVLDVMFSVVFIAIMFAYSVPLTLIVLVSLPLYAALSLTLLPILRARLAEKFARGAENQALLVESITGIQTVKASALEPTIAKRWDDQLAAYVSASFKTSTLASYGHEGINLIGKLVGAATLWYGARLVMDQQLTVGQFIAFNMFAQRVAQPIMRMAQLWTDFQQTGISMARLGDILNTRTEVPPSTAAQLPALKGQIQFDAVNFRYRAEAPPVLHGLSLDVRPGEVIGIVGRSGSGKSTLTKLVQRLYTPEQGRVLVDGIDISLIDAAQLRRQIGVVLQENWLFNRSVRENIAITDPAAPIEQVMHAAGLAGAHEFIAELPEGYDTLVGEQGASLSGGQRQSAVHASAHPDLRRGDECARLRERGDPAAEHGRDLPRPHRDHHRAPAQLGAPLPPHRRDGQGADRRAGAARRVVAAA
jgi:ATP-binding cassette, subfamily B, bacterial HlyB/CyaB